jgi:site-specific recombinase XerD
MVTKEIIDQYLESKRHKWSMSTVKSERARLMTLLPALEAGLSPNECIDRYLKKNGSGSTYAAKTMVIRVGSLHEWMAQQGLRTGPNLFKDFLKDNYKFKNAYKKEKLGVDYDTAKKCIEKMPAGSYRDWAEYLLCTGLRPVETTSISRSGDDIEVTGKQGKSRTVFKIPPTSQAPPYRNLYNALRRVGLKPKDLRKLFATRLVDKGLAIKDVMEVMGWSSMQTADSYLQSKKKDVLKGLIYG